MGILAALVISVNPVIFQIGPFAVRWYGLMYVVGILIALWVVTPYMQKRGISPEKVYQALWWLVVAGVAGGRLYFVVQQPDLVSHYLSQPLNIIATWQGGMAFYGAIFGVVLAIWYTSWRYHFDFWIFLDGAAIFGAVSQPFGRIGNIINGDVVGSETSLPWGTIYHNGSPFLANPIATSRPVHPAAIYEILLNIVLFTILWRLRFRFCRPGTLFLIYLASYALGQFAVFFVRTNAIVAFGLKQAQLTSIVILVLLIPFAFWFSRRRLPEASLVHTSSLDLDVSAPIRTDTVGHSIPAPLGAPVVVSSTGDAQEGTTKQDDLPPTQPPEDSPIPANEAPPAKQQ